MLRNLKNVWTTEDDRRLLELRAAGRSSISIGVALKRSSRAVNSRLSLLRADQRSVATSGPSGDLKPEKAALQR
jgi:hypothetical protein